MHRANRRHNADLLLQTKLVAKTIDPYLVASLGGVKSDLTSPTYLRLLEQLNIVRLVNPKYRYIYLMGRNPEGRVFFYMTAQATDEKTPPDLPGSIYEEASDELQNVFASARAFIEGPLPDEWGVWVSALVPLTDPQTGSVLAVLGIDIDARDWNRQVFSRAALPSALSTLAILFALASLLLLRSRRSIRARQTRLEESEALFSQIAVQSRTVVWEVDAAGLFTYVSAAAEIIYGHRPDELVGRMCFYDLHSAAERDAFKQTILQMFGRKEAFVNFENRALTKDGRTMWLSTNAFPVQNADGTLIGYCGSDMDITERKRAEEALVKRCLYETYVADACALLLSNPDRQSDKQMLDSTLALLLKASSAHRVYIFKNTEDPVDGLCLEQTHEACADGIAPQIDNPLLRRICYSDIIPRWHQELSQGRCIQGQVADFPPEERAILKPQGVVSLLAIPIHSDGAWRGFIGFDYVGQSREWDEDDVKLLRTAAEVIGGFLHAAELRAALQEERDRYERTIALLSDIIWTYETDANQNFVNSYISPAADRMLALPPGTIGQSFEKLFSFVHPDDLPAVRKKLMESQANQSTQGDIEYRIFDNDGNQRWVLSRGSAYCEPDGNFIVYGTISDITERKQTEEAVRKTNLQLEESIARANHLAEKAKMASLAKGRFLMQMSHEIRTPMNAVLGMADMLEESPLDSDQRNFLGILQASGNHLLGVINDILDYSKLESRSVQLADLPFDIHQAAKQCAQLIAVKALEKALEISCTVAPDVPQFIRGDELRLRQVIINLMGNALKFTEKGSVRLVLDRLAGNRLRLTVRDTGIGIPYDQIPLIFQRFYQTDLTLARRYGGSGLGLTITRELVELMGGEIQLTSTLGKGSAFSVIVPLRPAEPAALAASGAPAPTEVSAPVALAHMSILLVEDVDVNREMIKAFLRQSPVEIVEAVNGREAVDQCARRRFDLVLMDIEMPEMDGLTATRLIREAERKAGVPPVPLFELTAHAMAELTDKCLEAGAQRVLTKPIRKKVLLAVLQDLAPSLPLPSENTQASSPSGAPIDLSRLICEFDDDAALAMQLLHDWLSTLPRLASEIRAAFDAHRIEDLRRVAHKVKGAAANLAADPLSRIAAQLEQAAAAADIDACQRLIPAFQAACDHLAVFVANARNPRNQESEP